MTGKKIVLLAGEWDTTAVVYNFLVEHFNVAAVIIEKPVPRKQFLKARAKKLGYFTVGGQVLFQLLIAKALKKRSATRIQHILKENHLSSTGIPSDLVHPVPSVNDEQTMKLLQLLQPDLVIVHGTRIISKKILQSTPATFINIHAGITPRYRGSHGAYWALANNDTANCGVTVHLVDAGIDTGGIVAQATIDVKPEDNFATYPYLQLAKGLQLLKNVIPDFFAGKLERKKNNLDSALWHHPTLWYYLGKRLFKKIK
jgi:folate-dependent phosphoribosylglycinamide formyltransferase PurN